MNILTSEKEPKKDKSDNEILNTNQHINSKYKLVCTKEGIQISMLSSDLLDLSFKSETISYDDKRINGLRISVERIIPDIDKGKFIFYASEIMFEPSPIKDSNIKSTNSKEGRIVVFGNEEINWNLKRDLLTIPAEWLVNNGRIKKEDMPVYDVSGSQGRGKLYLLNKVPKHPNESDFISYKQLADGIYLFKNYSGRNCIRNGEYLMKKFAPDVKFSILGYSEA